MNQTRRLAAILAADVVGYSRLIGADEDGTLRKLRAIREELIDPAIAAHHGRLVKTTGDGLLIEFSSVVDALCSATEIQAGVAERNAAVPEEQRIEFRMGLNVGDIAAEDSDIFGDGVNVAARLEALAEPGGICVSARVQEDAAGKLDLAFEDMGEQQLKNITRPVRVYRVQLSPTAVTKAPLPLPDKPSLVVLPFQNMTGDAEQDYFVDGVVEEITTAISRLPWLFVIARNSAFTYKGRAVDVKQVARELSVRYVLEGSVRKAGNRVRITGQLIDTAISALIWADRFDSALDDIFELQDQMASSVVVAVEPKLRQSEIERASRKPTDSLDAYDLYLRALAQTYRLSDDSIGKAILLLQQALAIDPFYAPAAARLAWCRVAQFSHGWGAASDDDAAEAVRLAKQAIELGNDDPDTLGTASLTLSALAGEHETAAAGIDRALKLNPNSALAWRAYGYVSCFRNRPGPAIEAFQHVMRLSPLDPQGWMVTAGLAFAHLAAGQYEQAIEWADRSLREQPRNTTLLRAKAVSYAHLDRIPDARDAVAKLLALQPRLTIANLRLPSLVPELAALQIEGLRKAGLPEE